MSIRRQVLRAIEAKIAEAQEACDCEVRNLEAERKGSIARTREALNQAIRTFFVELGRIKTSFRNRKEEIEARHVNSILSKVL